MNDDDVIVVGDAFVYKFNCAIIDIVINITPNEIFYHRVRCNDDDQHSTFVLSQPDFHSVGNWTLI